VEQVRLPLIDQSHVCEELFLGKVPKSAVDQAEWQ
jgi:hypothetical protein